MACTNRESVLNALKDGRVLSTPEITRIAYKNCYSSNGNCLKWLYRLKDEGLVDIVDEVRKYGRITYYWRLRT